MIHKILNKIERDGFGELWQLLSDRLFARKIAGYTDYIPFFQEKHGLEIGGPSSIFKNRNICPIYSTAKSIDNCNFSSATVWEGSISHGKSFKFSPHREPGEQFVSEAYDLNFAVSETYDFIISSHMIEHSANPLKVLTEWKRVLKNEGMMVIVIPHKDRTFDRYRPVTDIEHMIQDFNNQIDESDLTHLDEILRLHDLTLDPLAGNIEQFTARCYQNFQNRCIHHHVFDTKCAIKLINAAQLEIKNVVTELPNHIVIFAQKVDSFDNSSFLNSSLVLLSSVFASDK